MRLAFGIAVSLGVGVIALAVWPRSAVWPDPAAELRLLDPPPAAARARRIALDPGHGAPGNSGNRSAYCVDEQEFTLELAEDLAGRLRALGGFEVRLTRARGELVTYPERITRAEAWGAELLLSLHSDVRGRPEPWEPEPGRSCPRSRDEPGFAVLFSDSGEPARVERCRELAAQLARSLATSGFLPYSGEDYGGSYAPEASASGVFVDRHDPGKRIFLLWRPAIPAVLVETHNALDDREEARWRQERTRAAFARAVANALALAP
jgi:N-acetylmuramoyl-L-alanine amidase